MVLNFGDGSSAKLDAKAGAPAVFSHVYKTPGNYPVIAAGETLKGLWGPVAEYSHFVRDNPYEAVLSCGFRGQHMNIAACFAGGSHSADTELEVRTGSHYALYKSWELNRAGTEGRGTGLIIPLKANFEIKAQNCSDSLTLTLKIRETATGCEVFVKSAAQYGVVSTRH